MSVNKIAIKGHVGRLETVNEGSDKQFVSMSVSVSEYMGKDESGESRYQDTWFDAVAFGGKGTRMLAAGVKVGDYVEIEGRMSKRQNEKDGRVYDNWSVIADEFEVLRRKEVAEGAPAKAAPKAAAKPAAKPAAKKAAPKPEPAPAADEGDWDDEIPFGL